MSAARGGSPEDAEVEVVAEFEEVAGSGPADVEVGGARAANPDAEGSGSADTELGGADPAGSKASGTDPAGSKAGGAGSDGSGAASAVRVVVVDDQAMVRGALAALLDLEDDIEVVGEAGDGSAAVEAVGPGGPRPVDVVLMDVEMPVMDGITACAAVLARSPRTRVLMLTTFGRPGYVRRALEAGATGFVVKDAPSEQLADAVRRVSRGERVIDPTLAVETLTRGASPLTDREVEVLQAVAMGGTIADIAGQLQLGQGTVRNHVSSAMAKTQARTRAEAVRIATESGWL